MIRYFTLISLLLGVMLVTPNRAIGLDLPPSNGIQTANGLIADSEAGFSNSQGQNNWFYGYYVSPFKSSTFQQIPNYSPTYWTTGAWSFSNGIYWTKIGATRMHPNSTNTSYPATGLEQWVARRWISTVSGSIDISGAIAKGDSGGDGITGHIIIDGAEIWSQYIAPADSVGKNYTVTTSVKVGSKVDFVISPNTSDYYDTTLFTAKIGPPKPPLVLVHGFLGFGNDLYTDTCTPGVTQPFHYSADPSSRDDGVGGRNIAYFADVPERLNQNYDVWIAHVASGPTDSNNRNSVKTPSLYTNANCLASQLKYIQQFKLQPITLIAHSMGGLVSRACISQNYDGCGRRVQRLFTLGSPHAGLTSLPIYWFLRDSKAQPGFLEMASVRMPDFNTNNDTKRDVVYMFLGGTGGSLYTDGAVTSWSSLGWTKRDGTMDPAGWDANSMPSRFWTDEFHGKYFSDRAGNASHAYQCITWFVNGQIGSSDAFCHTATPTLASAARAAQAGVITTQTTPMLTGALSAGGQVNHTIHIDSSGTSSFSLSWITGDLSLTLIQPGGQVIDSAYANAHPEVVTYTVIPSSLGVFNQITYSFTNTIPGAWQVQISDVGTASANYLAYAQLDTTRSLDISTSAENFAIGSQATLTARLTNGASGIPSATVTAQLIRADNITDTLVLTHQGQGVYRANYTVPNARGYLPVTVSASGIDNGTAFERQQLLMLAISPNTAHLTGSYSSTGVDSNHNGLLEKLDIPVGLNSTVSGTVTLSGDLVAGNRIVAHASAYTNVIAGTQSVILSFFGEDIYLSQMNGPYTLTNVTLSDMAYGSIPIAIAKNAYSTAAYRHTDFEGTRKSYLPLIHP